MLTNARKREITPSTSKIIVGNVRRTGRMKARQKVCEILGSAFANCKAVISYYLLFVEIRVFSVSFFGFFFFKKLSMTVIVALKKYYF